MTTTLGRRRTVDYADLDEFRADAERLAAGPYETVGNWSFGKILQHLAWSLKWSLDGFPMQGPWLARRLIGPAIKRRLLHRKMKPGFRLRGRARELLPDEGVAPEAALRELTAVLDRFKTEEPRAEHPLLGRMSPDEWNLLHLRHAELHMSFVREVPT